MSYQPYTTGNNYGQKKQQGGSSSNYNPYQNVTPAPASSYNPYENIPKTTTTTTSNNAYGATAPSAVPASSYNPYQNVTPAPAVPASAASASTYNPYENIPKPTTTTTTTSNSAYGAPVSTSPTSKLPDFSQALDVPPPSTNPTYGATAASSKGPSYGDTSATAPVATAYPMGSEATATTTGGGTSLVTSVTYQGGPTNGLVSEGNPVKCHKVDYEIKGHEMQLVE